MSQNDWYLFKVRPHNSPIRHMAAMSHLILRYWRKGIPEEIINMVKETPVVRGFHTMEKNLVITTDLYQASYFDFGSDNRITSKTLLVSWRAADILVNAPLPFLPGWSRYSLQPELEEKAFTLYRN